MQINYTILFHMYLRKSELSCTFETSHGKPIHNFKEKQASC